MQHHSVVDHLGIQVFERGWLSSNNILLLGPEQAALVDSGYASHSPLTCTLIQQALAGRTLDHLLNTHLHSDHCGGNAALQQLYPEVQTWIPPGQAHWVEHWNPTALSYEPTGQICPAFRYDHHLQPGQELQLGQSFWQIHAAPGHDPHSVILFEPQAKILISADALWETGFGVVFPELDGQDAFEQVAQTLDLIEALQPHLIIPGHGRPFRDLPLALESARKRLDGFVQHPLKHAQHAAKVLLKFKLLEWQSMAWKDVLSWAEQTPLLVSLHQRFASNLAPFQAWLEQLRDDLIRAHAAHLDCGILRN